MHMFQDHPIFYRKYAVGNRAMYTFRNDFLKAEEEKDFLARSGSSARFTAIRERKRICTWGRNSSMLLWPRVADMIPSLMDRICVRSTAR